MKTSIRNIGSQLLVAGLLLTWLTGASLHAQFGPTLVSSSPPNAATGVALDSDISFTFSAAMKPQESIFWSGLDTNKLSFAWSADAKTLTCSYAGNLPSGAQITWTLLGSDLDPAGFEDQAGNPLSFFPLPLGSFMTASGSGGTNDCSGSSGRGNFTLYSLFKSAMYVQNGSGASTPDTSSDPFLFGATINLATNRTATTATLTVGSGSPQSMSSFISGSYLLFDSAADLAALDALYPAGAYTFTVTGSPNQTVPATLPANTLPNPPHVSNYAAAQTINAGASFSLQWDPFAGGRAIDSISVTVYDPSAPSVPIFQITNSAGCPSVLPGTATNVVIPANTFVTNKTYTTDIMFLKSVSFDTNSFPGSVVSVGGQSSTELTIATSGGGVTPPPSMVLTNLTLMPSGQFQFQFATAPGTLYTVEYSSDLSNPLNWTQLVVSNAVGNTIQVTDGPHPESRMYRTRHN